MPPEILDQFGSPMLMAPEVEFPSIIIDKPFTLESQSKTDLDRIRDEVMDKTRAWQNQTRGFIGEYREYSESWRVQARDQVKKPKGMFNSKSGETHRAVETLATLWFRMGTASDDFFEAIQRGYDPRGMKLTPADLFAIEKLISQQLRSVKFKDNLLVALRSLALFGTTIIEENWVRRMNLDGKGYFEGTTFEPRSLLNTGFDTSVPDLDFSDYIFTVDYPTVWRLKQWAKAGGETWDGSVIEKHTADQQYNKNVSTVKTSTDVYNNILERKQRAGYNLTDYNIRELISYHGKIDTENPVVQRYWESMGFQDDPADCDFTSGILDGDDICKFHVTQYKTWHSKFKYAHFKRFELEPLGYGVGKIGKKNQREIDVSLSRANDALALNIIGVWKLGRFAGIQPNQFQIKPHHIVSMEDVSQLEQVKMDINSVVQAIAMIANSKEDFRSSTGASSNLQAVNTRATATEASLTQNEAIRGGSVHAEIIFESLMREHLQQCHINNLDNLDEDIWVSIAGEEKPRYFNKNNLPSNIGFEVRITTDKNFRPERLQKILEGLNFATHANNMLPPGVNFFQPLAEEYFKALDINPRLLQQPISIQEQAVQMLKFNRASGMQGGRLGFSDSSGGGGMGGGTPEAEAAGQNSQTTISTPMGPVATSPQGADYEASA